MSGKRAKAIRKAVYVDQSLKNRGYRGTQKLYKVDRSGRPKRTHGLFTLWRMIMPEKDAHRIEADPLRQAYQRAKCDWKKRAA